MRQAGPLKQNNEAGTVVRPGLFTILKMKQGVTSCS